MAAVGGGIDLGDEEKKREQPPQNAPLISEQFTFEHRDSKGRLIATNKNLKALERIKMYFRRVRRRHARV